MAAREELRKYANLLADSWTPRETTDDRVEWLYSQVRREVLYEAADALEARVADVDVDTRTTWAGMDATYLRHLADKATEQDGKAPAFFRPGRTYRRIHHGQPIEFRVRYVSEAPDGSYQAAHGWRHDPEEGWVPGDADDLDGWTEQPTPAL